MIDKEKLYQEQKKLIDSAVDYIALNPAVSKIMATIKEVYAVGFSVGMVEGLKELKKMQGDQNVE